MAVEMMTASTSGDSVTKLVAGDVDIAYSSYPALFLAESRGVGRGSGGVKLVADASSAGPDSCVVVALPNSPVKSARDLAGRRVAVTGFESVSVAMIMSTMAASGVDYGDVQWVKTPFPRTAEVLKRGDVDAAFVTEPFIQDAQKRAGAVTVFDTATGPTANFPTAGWGSTGDFVRENPETVAAFQRVMQKATDVALADRNRVEELLVRYSKVDEGTAKLATLLTFQSKMDHSRIQRAADLMWTFRGVYQLSAAVDVADMIVPSPPQS